MPPNKGSSIAAKVVGGVVGLLVLVGVVVLIVKLAGGGMAPLPFDAANLPPSVRSVSRYSLEDSLASARGLQQDDLPEQALWSSMSEKACGGYDLFGELMGATDSWGRKYAAKALAHKIEKHRQALKCGKKMAANLKSGTPYYWISIQDGDKRRSVGLFEASRKELPKTEEHLKSIADPSNIEQTHCLVPWGQAASEDCEEEARAVGRIEKSKLWARATLKSLTAFGKDYSSSGDNDSSQAKALETMASKLGGYERAVIGVPEGYGIRITGMTRVRVSMYGEDTAKALIKIVKDESKAWGIARNGRATWGKLELVIRAKSERSAKNILKALKSFHTKLKAKMAEAVDPKRDEKDAEQKLAYDKAKQTMARRALRKAKIKRDGKDIRLSLEEEPKKSEKKAIEAFFKWRKKHAAVAARIIDGILKNKEPSKADLEKIGGNAFAKEAGNQLALHKGEWPYEPEAWSEVPGFKVPGGGTFSSMGDMKKKFYMFKYPIERPKLLKLFKKVLEDAGWVVTVDDRFTDNPGYEATKGSTNVGILVTKPTGGGSALVLAPRKR